MGTKPIRLEVVFSAGQTSIRGMEKTVDALAGRIDGRVKQTATNAVASIERIEQALAKLNRTGLPSFASQFREANEALRRIDDTLRRVEPVLARMRRLSAVKGTSGLTGANAERFTRADGTSLRAPGIPVNSKFRRLLGEGLSDRLFRQMRTGATQTLGPLQAVSKVISGIGDGMTRLAATIYSIRSIGRALEFALVAPFKNGLKYIIDATEQSRQFELSIAGVVGGLSKARAVNAALVNASQSLPIGVAGLRDIARQMGYVPSLSSRVALGSESDAARAVGDFSKLIARLATLDPQQGEQGALLAVREGLAGEFRSLRQRLEIQPEAVAAAIGKTQRDLAGDPRLFLQALNAYAEQFIPDSVLAERANLYTVRVEKLQDAFERAAELIGNSGVFDDIINGLEGFSNDLFRYADSADFRTRAKAISQNLSAFLGNVSDALLRFLRSLAGVEQTGAKSPEALARLLEGLSGKLADASKGIPLFAEAVGDALNDLWKRIDKIISLVEYRLSNPGSIPRDAVFDAAASLATDPNGSAITRGPATAFANAWARVFGAPKNFSPILTGPTTRPAAPPPVLDAMGQGKGDPFYRSGFRPDVAEALRSVPKEALEFSTFRNMFTTAQNAAYRLGEGYEDSDAIRRLQSAASGQLQQILTGFKLDGDTSAGDLFDRVRKIRDDLLAPLEKAAGAVGDQLSAEADEAVARRLRERLAALETAQDRISSSYGEEFRKVTEAMRQGAVNFGLGLGQALEGEAPEVASIFLREAISGNTAIAKAVRERLEALPELAGQSFEFGLLAQPAREQVRTQQALVRAQLGALENSGRFGGALDESNLGLSADDILRRTRHPLMEARVKRSQLEFLRSTVGTSSATLGNARAEYEAAVNSGDLVAASAALRTLQQARLAVADLGAGIYQLERDLDGLGQAWRAFGGDVGQALENTLGNTIHGLITGANDLKETLRSFASDISQAFSQMIARGFLINTLGGTGFGNWAGIPAPAVKAANGAVWEGGFTPLHAFANGGIVDRPVVGLVGEGRFSEAIVPLPDGKSIPVQMMGGGERIPDLKVVVVNDWVTASRASIAANADVVVNSVTADVRRGARLKKALKRSPR